MLDSIFSNVNFDIKAVLIAMGAAIILGIFIGILYKCFKTLWIIRINIIPIYN